MAEKEQGFWFKETRKTKSRALFLRVVRKHTRYLDDDVREKRSKCGRVLINIITFHSSWLKIRQPLRRARWTRRRLTSWEIGAKRELVCCRSRSELRVSGPRSSNHMGSRCQRALLTGALGLICQRLRPDLNISRSLKDDVGLRVGRPTKQ